MGGPGSRRDLMARISFRAFWVNASLSLLVVMVLLGALEFGARLLGAKPLYGGPASVFVEDRELLWRLRPNCNVVWRGHRAGINSVGFRSPQTEYATSSRPRILVIGDSVTYGDGVARERTYPNLLNDMLHHGTSANAGVPGYGVIQSFGLLRKTWDTIEPDIVIFGYCLNDAHDDLVLTHHVTAKLQERKRFQAQPAYNHGVLLRSAFWSWVQKTRWKREQRSQGAVLLRTDEAGRKRRWKNPGLRDIWAPNTGHPLAETTWRLLRSSLSNMSQWVGSREARLIVVCFPFMVQMPKTEGSVATSQAEGGSAKPIRSPAPQRGLSDLCANLGIEFLDLYPVFVAGGFRQQFVDKNHLSETGHRTTARALFNHLQAGFKG